MLKSESALVVTMTENCHWQLILEGQSRGTSHNTYIGPTKNCPAQNAKSAQNARVPLLR